MAKRTPEQAIRAFCLECSNHSKKEVELCTMAKCPLYPFRLKSNQEPREDKDQPVEDPGTDPQQSLFD